MIGGFRSDLSICHLFENLLAVSYSCRISDLKVPNIKSKSCTCFKNLLKVHMNHCVQPLSFDCVTVCLYRCISSFFPIFLLSFHTFFCMAQPLSMTGICHFQVAVLSLYANNKPGINLFYLKFSPCKILHVSEIRE